VLHLLSSGFVRYFLFLGAYVLVALRWEPWDYRGELPGEVYGTDPEGKVAHIYMETKDGDRFVCWDLRAWRETARIEREEHRDERPAIHAVLSELDGARLVALGKIDKRCFSSDGEFMLAREEGSREFAWTEVRTGRKLAKLPCRRIADVCFSRAEGGAIVLGYLGRWVGCWDTRSDAFRYRIAIPGTTGMKLVLSPCGKRALAVSDWRGRGVLLDLASRRVVRELGFRDEFSGIVMKRSPFHLAFSPCGRRVVGGIPDGWMAIWDAATGRSIGEYLVGSAYGSSNGAFSFASDGKRLAAWPLVIDLETGDLLADLDEVSAVRSRPDPEAMPRMLHDDVFVAGRHVFLRRHPEWWWGHLYRPEVWAAAVFGMLWLWSVARWLWRNRTCIQREWRRGLCLDPGT
jgi:hypothetical protein